MNVKSRKIRVGNGLYLKNIPLTFCGLGIPSPDPRPTPCRSNDFRDTKSNLNGRIFYQGGHWINGRLDQLNKAVSELNT